MSAAGTVPLDDEMLPLAAYAGEPAVATEVNGKEATAFAFEEAVIGALFIGAAWAEVAGIVHADDYSPPHRMIVAAFAAVAADGKPHDPVTVAQQLEQMDHLQAAGGLAYLLKLANETATPIVPQGGNTGLVGGQIPHHNEIVLSLNRLDRIREVDPTSNTITCEAGVTLQRTREAAAAQERGVVSLAKELLPALDNLDRAIAAAAADDPLLQGVRLVRSELGAALARTGIESFSPVGEPFDPAVHEAVATAEQPLGGAQSGTVVEVYQPGYRRGSSIIRPARVVVAA